MNVKTNGKETPAREIQNVGFNTYHELPGLNHETKDVLKQLQANVRTLEDLGGRLGFLMGELRGLIRR